MKKIGRLEYNDKFFDMFFDDYKVYFLEVKIIDDSERHIIQWMIDWYLNIATSIT